MSGEHVFGPLIDKYLLANQHRVTVQLLSFLALRGLLVVQCRAGFGAAGGHQEHTRAQRTPGQSHPPVMHSTSSCLSQTVVLFTTVHESRQLGDKGSSFLDVEQLVRKCQACCSQTGAAHVTASMYCMQVLTHIPSLHAKPDALMLYRRRQTHQRRCLACSPCCTKPNTAHATFLFILPKYCWCESATGVLEGSSLLLYAPQLGHRTSPETRE